MTTEEEIPEQAEDIPGRPIAWAIVGVAITIAACVVVVWAIESRLGGGGRSDVTELSLSPPATPFSDTVEPLELERAVQLRELEAWSWVDRAHHQVRVPVDVVIDRYLEERGSR